MQGLEAAAASLDPHPAPLLEQHPQHPQLQQHPQQQQQPQSVQQPAPPLQAWQNGVHSPASHSGTVQHTSACAPPPEQGSAKRPRIAARPAVRQAALATLWGKAPAAAAAQRQSNLGAQHEQPRHTVPEPPHLPSRKAALAPGIAAPGSLRDALLLQRLRAAASVPQSEAEPPSRRTGIASNQMAVSRRLNRRAGESGELADLLQVRIVIRPWPVPHMQSASDAIHCLAVPPPPQHLLSHILSATSAAVR